MTDNRLPYETRAGELSSTDTYQQLHEYLRLAEEDLRQLSDFAAQRSDASAAFAWKTIAKKFSQMNQVVSHLTNTRTRTSVGFHVPSSKN